MSMSSVSAAAARDKREDIVGVGKVEKSLIQLSIMKPGKVMGEYSVGSNGGDQKMEIVAWSNPRESLKDMEMGEKWPVHKADLFKRNRSITESRSNLFLEWVPFLVAAPAGLTSKRSNSSNHFSRGAAQLDTVAVKVQDLDGATCTN